MCVLRCRLWLTFSVGVHFILHPYLYYCVCLRRFGDYPLICICVCLFFIHFPMCVNATHSKHISIFMTSHVPRNMLWSCVAPVWQLTPRPNTWGETLMEPHSAADTHWRKSNEEQTKASHLPLSFCHSAEVERSSLFASFPIINQCYGLIHKQIFRTDSSERNSNWMSFLLK